MLWGFISRYAPGVTPDTHPELDRLAGYAIRYFEDFVKAGKTCAPDEVERQALAKLSDALAALPAGTDSETIRTQRSTSPARSSAPGSRQADTESGLGLGHVLPDDLPGADRPRAGPRWIVAPALYGIAETRALIDKALAGELAA